MHSSLKYDFFLNYLSAQTQDHIHRSLGVAAIYYTAVGLEKM